MMKVVDVQDADALETPHQGDIRKLFAHEHATIVHIKLEPGEALRMHVTPVDVCFYIVEGTGTVQVGKEMAEVGPDRLIFSPKGVPHRLYNDKDATFRFLVIKTPTPTTETKFL